MMGRYRAANNPGNGRTQGSTLLSDIHERLHLYSGRNRGETPDATPDAEWTGLRSQHIARAL
jgi:hypothetical protein